MGVRLDAWQFFMEVKNRACQITCQETALPGLNEVEGRLGHVPEGHPTIARRFNAGENPDSCTSPAGTAETARQPSLRDSGHMQCGPGVETPGYSRLSLRDAGIRNPIL